MSPIPWLDEQYEATFRAAVEAAVRAYEECMRKGYPLPPLLDDITAAAQAWVEEKANDRYWEGVNVGRDEGAEYERNSHTCERD